MSLFPVNFRDFGNKIVAWLFRPMIRMRAFRDSFLKAIKDINNQLVDLVEDTDFKLRWNAQVIYLEKYLNTLYDPAAERIWIQNIENDKVFLHLKSEPVDPIIIYTKAESQPPVYLRTGDEIQGEIDYIVNIPNDVFFDQDVITAQIKTYNVAGKRFEIQTF